MRKRSILRILLMLSVLATAFPSVRLASSVSVTWNAIQRFTSIQSFDFEPAILQSANGTTWVFWQGAPLATPWAEDILLRTTNSISPTFNSSLWSPTRTVVSTTAQDVSPQAVQSGNGTIFLSFASNRTGTFQIFLKRYNQATGWTPDFQLTTSAGSHQSSSVVSALDGSLWVFYDAQTFTATNIYYKTYRSGSWSAETALTSDSLPVQNQQPSAYQLSDGRIFVAWSQVGDTHFNKVYIFSKTYSGSTWSTAQQLTSTGPDRLPATVQDSAGTIWLVWTREYQITPSVFEDNLVYKSSTDGGSSWSSETMLTNNLSCSDPNCYDSIQPDIEQMRDGRIYVFWSTDADPQSYWNIYYTASNPLPMHNVAVTSLGVGPAKLRDGETVSISVTVANVGNFTETFQVNVAATNKTTVTIGSGSVTLSPGGSRTLTFAWNTGPCSPRCSAAPGKYSVTASIPHITGQKVTIGNVMSTTVWLVPPGDVDSNGRVDVIDAALAGYAFDSTPGMHNWNQNADLDGNGVVNLLDVATVAYWFGTST